MDILIKGIEISREHPVPMTIIYEDGLVLYEKNNVLGHAKAITLPKHGDLVDRSLLKGASYEIMRFPADEANECIWS